MKLSPVTLSNYSIPRLIEIDLTYYMLQGKIIFIGTSNTTYTHMIKLKPVLHLHIWENVEKNITKYQLTQIYSNFFKTETQLSLLNPIWSRGSLGTTPPQFFLHNSQSFWASFLQFSDFPKI